MNWTKEKPVLDRKCILLTASKDTTDYYDCSAFQILYYNVEDEGYWSINEFGEGEWGDYADLEAQWYLIIDYPNKQ